MNTIHYFKNSLKALAFVCCGLLLSAGFAACSDSNDDNSNSQGGNEQPQKEEAITYDDLSYFQNSIIEVDENDNIVAQYVGTVLFEDDPQHLYIGVDTYEEAEAMFRQWIAPDVTLPATAPLTAQLTDTLGKAQGSVTFTKSTENGAVAEVTASAGTQLKHFNKVSFLLNSAWPHNAASPIHHVGDVIPVKLIGSTFSRLTDDDHKLNFVCIQEERNGQKPIFVAITRHGYDRGAAVTMVRFHLLSTSTYSPNLARATAISEILRTRWDGFCVYFDRAKCGSLRNDGFWINYIHSNILFEYDEYMYFQSGAHYGATNMIGKDDRDIQLPFLLKIDWLSDAEVSQMLTPTNGSAKHGNDESYDNLFDNNTASKWYSRRDNKDEVWFVEFNSLYSTKPTGYKLFTANDTQKYWGRNPTKWKLLGRYNNTDEWTLLDERDTDKNPADALPAANEAEKAFAIKEPQRFKYYRLEISDSKGGDIQLSKFLFTY